MRNNQAHDLTMYVPATSVAKPLVDGIGVRFSRPKGFGIQSENVHYHGLAATSKRSKIAERNNGHCQVPSQMLCAAAKNFSVSKNRWDVVCGDFRIANPFVD